MNGEPESGHTGSGAKVACLPQRPRNLTAWLGVDSSSCLRAKAERVSLFFGELSAPSCFCGFCFRFCCGWLCFPLCSGVFRIFIWFESLCVPFCFDRLCFIPCFGGLCVPFVWCVACSCLLLADVVAQFVLTCVPSLRSSEIDSQLLTGVGSPFCFL